MNKELENTIKRLEEELKFYLSNYKTLEEFRKGE